MSIPAESITKCDTKKFFNRANLYFTITYTYIMLQFARICCLCLDEITKITVTDCYIFIEMMADLFHDCKQAVKIFCIHVQHN